MNLSFEVGKKINSVNYHIFDIETYEKKAPNGKVGAFVGMKAPNWCGAIVFNQANGKFVCVQEYRHGVNKVVTQFPCGTVEGNESAKDCCIREVCEELGIKQEDVSKCEQLFSGCPNPAFMNNTMTFFLIGLKDFVPNKQHLDAMEFVNVKELSESEVEEFLKEPDAAVMQQFAWTAMKYKFKV